MQDENTELYEKICKVSTLSNGVVIYTTVLPIKNEEDWFDKLVHSWLSKINSARPTTSS
jgi:hypothetical protein